MEVIPMKSKGLGRLLLIAAFLIFFLALLATSRTVSQFHNPPATTVPQQQ
jgi:hypothetical protein